MFKIGDFSKLAQVSVKTLRHYGKLGLLQPAWIDRFSGYRYYTAEQLPRLNRILALKDLGFSLEQVRSMLQDDLPSAELRGMIRLKQAELERQVAAEQARLERVEARLRQIEREGSLPLYEVILKSVPGQRVAGMRALLPGLQQIGGLFSELLAHLRAAGTILDETSPRLAIYYDQEYREQSLDVEVAVPLARPFPGMPPLVVHELAGAENMACAVHQGPYEQLGEAYNALLTWVETNGYRAAGPNRDVYLPGAASQADLITEAQLPVQKKPMTFFFSGLQEREKMEPQLVSKAAFIVVGAEYYGKNENNEIAVLWREISPRFKELQNVIGDAYGLCQAADASGAFKYLAGLEVADANQVPAGMVAWNVPAQQYAVFPTTLANIGATYQYAFETWLPSSGYEYTHDPDFEFYDEQFDNKAADSVLYIYIPIRPVK